MENKVDYIHAIRSKFYKFISYTAKTKETQKVRQNPEKSGCNSLRCILMAEFHLY